MSIGFKPYAPFMPITAYELTALSKQLRMEQLMVKKYRFFSAIATDQQLKLKCEQISAEHQEHYTRLLSYLN